MHATLAAIGLPFVPGWEELRPFIADAWLIVTVVAILLTPFFTTRASGTGLGLTVVKRIVDVHHGETSLRTEPGKGTTFQIRLPVVS